MNLSDSANKWHTALTRHIPPGQFGRYLLVGAWNALFGYGSFAFFTAVLSPMIPNSYIAASVISSLLNITVSFLGHKWSYSKPRVTTCGNGFVALASTAVAFSSQY
jgi:putative flippase GtrA